MSGEAGRRGRETSSDRDAGGEEEHGGFEESGGGREMIVLDSAEDMICTTVDFGALKDNELATLLGTDILDSIKVGDEDLGRILSAYLRNGLAVHNVYEQDLHIIVPMSVVRGASEYFWLSEVVVGSVACSDPGSVAGMSKWISYGNKLFDLIYFFKSPYKERIAITVYADEEAEEEDEDGVIHSLPTVPGIVVEDEADLDFSSTLVEIDQAARVSTTLHDLLCYYLWLMIRGGVQQVEDGEQEQKLPAFLKNSIGMSKPITAVVKTLASFSLTKVDPRWIKYVPAGRSAALIVNRLSLGVAGYRMLRPFSVYPNRPRVRYTDAERLALAGRLNPADPEGVLDQIKVYRETKPAYDCRTNAYNVAKAISQAPLDWAIHSATRAAWVINGMGGLNKPLQNLMLKCFDMKMLTLMASDNQRMIFRVPVETPGADTWRSWDMSLLDNLVDPILGSAQVRLTSVDYNGGDDEEDDEDDGGDGTDGGGDQGEDDTPPTKPKVTGVAVAKKSPAVQRQPPAIALRPQARVERGQAAPIKKVSAPSKKQTVATQKQPSRAELAMRELDEEAKGNAYWSGD